MSSISSKSTSSKVSRNNLNSICGSTFRLRNKKQKYIELTKPTKLQFCLLCDSPSRSSFPKTVESVDLEPVSTTAYSAICTPTSTGTLASTHPPFAIYNHIHTRGVLYTSDNCLVPVSQVGWE